MKVGSRAKLKDEQGEVTIIEVISHRKVMVKDENGFSRMMSVDEIILLQEGNIFTKELLEKKGHLNVKPKELPKPKLASPKPSSPKKQKVGERYIDLHDFALPEKYHRQLSLSKLERALSYFEDALWEASNSSDHRLLLNHGIGEGILKSEVRKRLDGKGYQYQDESFNNPGTTVVFLVDRL